jgi:drug/metabolite transporter (DMT)-like permease
MNVQGLKYSLYATCITSVLYNLLYFFGIRYTSPGNVSILALTEVFFSYLLFHVWRKDYIPKEHVIGAIFVFFGACIVLAPSVKIFRPTDLLIVIGAAIVPFGNFFAQKARKLVHTETIMFTRGFIGSIIIFILSFPFHATNPITDVTKSLLFLIINGLLLLGLSTFLWIEGIHRITVTKANALQSLSPLVTLLFAWILLKTSPSAWQLLSFIPMFFGILLLGKIPEKSHHPHPNSE